MNTTHYKEPTEQKEKQKDGLLLDAISLRDYFAAKAMPVTLTALWAQGQHATPIPDLAAKFAYEVADAMLKARGTT
tara:strand:- start:422 stop:649 length:228 start_codon:yes stop_codon:yes gene_type:complete